MDKERLCLRSHVVVFAIRNQTYRYLGQALRFRCLILRANRARTQPWSGPAAVDQERFVTAARNLLKEKRDKDE